MKIDTGRAESERRRGMTGWRGQEGALAIEGRSEDGSLGGNQGASGQFRQDRKGGCRRGTKGRCCRRQFLTGSFHIKSFLSVCLSVPLSLSLSLSLAVSLRIYLVQCVR